MPSRKKIFPPASPRRSDLAEFVNRACSKHAWLKPGDRVAAAVSGGADSVALLHLLLEIREKRGFVLSVAHFNHQLRGRFSDADEKFVRALAARHNLEFLSARENVRALAKRQKANLEEAARTSRYVFFDLLVRDACVHRVLVAHTADDQAETVLAHLLRGTGLAGLAGIHPETPSVIRPLLGLRRADLRAYLRARKQSWREDATNLDTQRTRARIRKTLVPLLESKFQPAVVSHLCQLAELARKDDAWLELIAAQWIAANCVRSDRDASLPRPALRAAPESLRRRAVRQIVDTLKIKSGQLGIGHVDAVLALSESIEGGKSLCLPGGVEVRSDRDQLRFLPLPGTPNRALAKAPPASLHKGTVWDGTSPQLRVQELSTVLHFRVIDWPEKGRETKPIGLVLDRERLQHPLLVRGWRPGDAMRPVGHQKRHSLARLLGERNVSRWSKQNWPVLTSAGEIAWVRGLPPAVEFAAGERTRIGVLITEESET